MSCGVIEMAISTLEAKAHELLGQLDHGKLAAVVHLLEVMVDDTEPVTEEDHRRLYEGRVWFAERGGKGIPMDEVLAEFGVTADNFPLK